MFRKRIRSSRAVEETRREYAVKAALISGVFVAMVCIASFTAHLPEVRIATIQIEGAVLTSQEALHTSIAAQLDGAYVWIFPRNATAIYPKQTILKDILDSFPSITMVHLEREGSTSLVATVGERAPAYLWCGDASPATKASHREECYFTDTEGVVFLRAPSFSDGIYMKLYMPVLGEAVRPLATYPQPLGMRLMESDRFLRLMHFAQSLEGEGVFVTSISCDVQKDCTLTLKNGVPLMIASDTALEVALRNLFATIETGKVTLDDLTMARRRFDYIDLRFDKKVFLKEQ